MQHAFRDDGTQVMDGMELTSFRGKRYRFDRVSREAQGNSEGRVLVSRPCADAINGECPHFYHHNGRVVAEYFPSVFDLTLREDETAFTVTRSDFV